MHALIDGILTYSRIGRSEEEGAEMDLSELLNEVIDFISLPRNIHIEIQKNLPKVRAEKTRMHQLFQNLIGNAIKFSDKPEGKVEIGCRADGAMWRFHVADNGPGIESKYFDKIFQLFQTLGSSDQSESTGIGLALVKRIVEKYGGRIWIESEVGKGATFYFTLPKWRNF